MSVARYSDPIPVDSSVPLKRELTQYSLQLTCLQISGVLKKSSRQGCSIQDGFRSAGVAMTLGSLSSFGASCFASSCGLPGSCIYFSYNHLLCTVVYFRRNCKKQPHKSLQGFSQ
jgi:hypothetical protein